jgi:RND family efflux transporter MFP subunit
MGRKILIIVIVVIALAGLAIAGIMPRLRNEKNLKQENSDRESQVPRVLLTDAKSGVDTLGLSISGRVEALKATEIFARSQGYVRSFSADIGAHVHKGQVLAYIDQPEVEQDIIAARTQADLAKTSLKRLEDVDVPGAVAESELDNARAQVRATQAQLKRLQELKSFQTIEAPFDGVITSRSLEVGTFVSPGTVPLFTLNTDEKVRIFVDVPQSESQLVHVDSGMATVKVPELANKVIKARIVRNTGTYDPTSRSLTVELIAPSGQGLMPGMYCTVFFQPAGDLIGLVSVPENAIYLAPTGPSVVVYQQDGTVRQSPIAIAKDRGAFVLVSAGAKAGDKLVVNPNIRLQDGTKVEIMEVRGEDKGAKDAKKG